MAKRKSGNTSKKKNTSPPPSQQSGSSSARKSRTRERREERQKKQRQQQQMLIIGGLVIAAMVVGVLLIVANQPADAPVPEDLVARYEGIPQTQTDEGYFVLGRPDAPVRVEEFSSFSCPGCEQFFSSSMDGLIELVVSGAISFTFIPQTTGSLVNAEGAARAALCAGEQGMFYEYHDMLFDWHTRFANTAYSQNRLRSGAENLGLDTGEFNSCLTGGESEDIVNAAIAMASERGVPGTPSTYVNGSPVESSLPAIQNAVQESLSFTGAVPVPIERDTGDDSGDDAAEATPEADESADNVEETTPEADESAAGEDSSEDEEDSEATPEAGTDGDDAEEDDAASEPEATEDAG